MSPLLTLPGRGTRLKGHADAIELVADLKARGIELRCCCSVRHPGRESYVAELLELAKARGVAERLAISAPREDVRDVYAISA